ncbi:MAG: PEGA domain-containing protein [Planctomycetes bacterium]|nr:PEGA domain-containing protein [Planctomycetota bacterium]
MRQRWFHCGLAILVTTVALSGCVERTLKITTNPPGARVFVNDEEVGTSPARVAFTWYGDYDIILRKSGYETLKTHYRVSPPWFQVPGVDFFTEVLAPGTLHDDHVLPTYELQPVGATNTSDLVGRAVEMQERATFEGD